VDPYVFDKAIAPALATVLGPQISTVVHGPKILDVGCGGGLIAGSVADSLNATVIGVDPSSAQVRRFNRRHRTAGSPTAVRGWAEELPFPDASFDSLYSSCAWKHWLDPGGAVAECARVVRPGSAITFIEIDRSSSREDWRSFASSGNIPRGLRSLVTWFTRKLVLPVAPDERLLSNTLEEIGAASVLVSKMPGLPFLVATAIAG
jgi:ubiquinone/menaquinone biosynthesis C-methylase UbiE